MHLFVTPCAYCFEGFAKIVRAINMSQNNEVKMLRCALFLSHPVTTDKLGPPLFDNFENLRQVIVEFLIASHKKLAYTDVYTLA